MFYEGDTVQVTHLHPNIQEMLADVMEVEFEDIDFYFVEYVDDENYAVLSAETDEKFAIIQCPVEALDGYMDYSEHVDKLLDHVINTHILNRALDEGNRELFQAVIDYRNAPKTKKEPQPQHVFVDMVYDVVADEEFEEHWEEELEDEEF